MMWLVEYLLFAVTCALVTSCFWLCLDRYWSRRCYKKQWHQALQNIDEYQRERGIDILS